MDYSVVLLAAGSGTRMNLGFNKMFLEINGQPIVVLTASKFFQDKACTEIIYVINQDDKALMLTTLANHGLLDKRCKVIIGGSERQYSVYNGLKHVTTNIVLVHDAARPFIKSDSISRLIETAFENGCAILGVKVKDTIKVIENEFVQRTLNRDSLFQIQTPQAYKTEILIQAHNLAKEHHFIGTDEASLIEHYKLAQVKLILGNYDNIKITTEEDALFAKELYQKYY